MSLRRLLPAVSAAVTLLAGCSAPASAPTSLQLRAGPCSPYRTPTTVAQTNALVAGLRDQPLAQGGDVGADTRLSDGRSLWVFGDTLREGATYFVRNSLLLLDGSCIRVLLPPDGGAVIPDRADGVGYWPMSVAVTHQDGTDLVGVAAQRVRTTGPGTFENLGPALAVLRVRDHQLPELLRVQDIGADSPDRRRPTWGAASWLADDGYVYLYGTSTPGTPLTFGFALSVARVPLHQVLDTAAWRYWDGRSWQPDPDRARNLVPAVGGVSQTLSVIQRDRRWYAISKRDEYLGTDLVIWSAPGPTGPFTPHDTGIRIPSQLSRSPDGPLFRYMPLAHPDLPAPHGFVIVSYSQGSDDLALLRRRPGLYRPHFLLVRLPTSA